MSSLFSIIRVTLCFTFFLTLNIPCAQSEPSAALAAKQPSTSVKLSIQKEFEGLTDVIAMQFVPGRTKSFVTLDDSGLLKRYETNASDESTLLYQANSFSDFQQRAAGTFVLHPEFSSNGRFFLGLQVKGSYGTDVLVVEKVLNPISGKIQEVPKPLLNLRQKTNENRFVSLAFDNEENILIGVSDGGAENTARDPHSFPGSVLKIGVSESGTYIAPLGNPFVMAGNGKAEVFAYGLRYPTSIVVEETNGDIYVLDRGLDSFDEINKLKAGKAYGWPTHEGTQCVRMRFECRNVKSVEPLLQFSHNSIGKVDLVAVLDAGKEFLIIDRKTARLRLAKVSKGKLSLVELSGTYPKFDVFTKDAKGKIYALNKSEGVLYSLKLN